MKPVKPFACSSIPAKVTFIAGKKHVTLEISNTSLSDWVDKEVVLTSLHISDRTLQYLRKTNKIPWSAIGGKIFYYLPGITFILEQSMNATFL